MADPTSTPASEAPAAQPPSSAAPPAEGPPNYRQAALNAILQGQAAETPPAETAKAPEAPAPPEKKAEEPPPAEAPKTEEKAEPAARHFEAIAREKAALRKEREALEAERSGLGRFREAAELARSGKHGAAAKALGLDYGAWTEEVLAGGAKESPEETPRERALREEVDGLKKWREEYQREQSAQAEHRQEVEILGRLGDVVKGAGEAYEYVSKLGERGLREAHGLLKREFEATGELPGGSPGAAMKWALDKVEAFYDEQVGQLLSTEKAKRRVAPAVTKSAASPQETNGQAVPRSLSNSQASAPPPRQAEAETADPEELRERTIRILRSSGL